MKIPKSVKIGGHIFKVEEKKLENNCGETYLCENRIVIHSDMPQSLKESTFFHEVMAHCINSTFSENHIAHSLMDSLSEQFYQVLKDNKMLK